MVTNNIIMRPVDAGFWKRLKLKSVKEGRSMLEIQRSTARGEGKIEFDD